VVVEAEPEAMAEGKEAARAAATVD